MSRGVLTETERFRLGPRDTPRFERVIADADLPFAPTAFWPHPEGPLAAAPDGNRSAHLVEPRVQWADREWLVGIKGIGAHTAPYPEERVRSERLLVDEAWFGESPYGAQGPAAARRGTTITRATEGASLHGFRFCPIVAVAELPPDLTEPTRNRFWYRRHPGAMVQEVRLLPSDVRLFHESRFTLGQDTTAVLQAFALPDEDAFEGFLERFLCSGMAALTLWARSLRSIDGTTAGLDLQAVWLDKDSVVASDGTLFFTDLEGLDWVPVWPSADERVRDQLDRSLYELLYGADVLLRWGEKRFERHRTRNQRRVALAARLELALAGDPFVRLERARDGLDALVRPAGEPPEIRVRLVDFEAGSTKEGER